MPVLKNAKHERFAQALAAGKTQIDAHKDAGFKPHRGNASGLAQDKNIAARVAELLETRATIEAKATEQAIEKLAITKEAVLGELALLGFSNMLDYVRIGDDGLPYTDFSALTREQAAAIQEVHVESTPAAIGEDGQETRPEVRKVRFKLADKRAALGDLGRHLGLFKERVELTGKDGAPIEVELTDLEAARRIAFLLTKAAHQTPKD